MRFNQSFYILTVYMTKNPLIKVNILLYVALYTLSCNNDNLSVDTPSSLLAQIRKTAESMYRSGNKEAAIKYVDSAYNTNTVGNIDRFDYYQFKYDAYYGLGKIDSVGIYADSMLALIDNADWEQDVYKTYSIRANYAKADWLYNTRKYKDAYKHYFIAKQQAYTSGDSCLMGYYSHKLAQVFYSSAQYKEAIKNFNDSRNFLSTCNDFGSFYRTQEIYDNIGLCFAKIGEHDSALAFYNKAINYLNDGYKLYAADQQLLLDKAKGVILGNMGSAYQELGNWEQAHKLYEQSIAINNVPEYDMTDALYTRIKLADLYINKQMLNKAKAELDTAAIISAQLNRVEPKLRWYKVMSKYYNALNDNREAVIYLTKYINLKDTIDQRNNSLEHIELESKVTNMEREAKINELKKTDASTTKLLALAIVVAFLAAVVSFLLYRNWRISSRNYNELKQLNIRINDQKEQLKRVLKDLNNAANEKDRILKAVSHDMRSPVNASLALAELISNDKEHLTAEQQDYLLLLKDSCNNALGLTKDLLEIATLSSEKIEKELVDVKGLIGSTTGLLKFKAAEKNQEIELNLTEEAVLAVLNKEKIMRVVTNLITNAIKFSPTDSIISVKLMKVTGGLQLSVKDNGIGIPDELKSKIFDLFTEAKRFGTAGEQPFGLGLSISKQIVEVHGGTIWFESVAQQGTTFYVSIPC